MGSQKDRKRMAIGQKKADHPFPILFISVCYTFSIFFLSVYYPFSFAIPFSYFPFAILFLFVSYPFAIPSLTCPFSIHFLSVSYPFGILSFFYHFLVLTAEFSRIFCKLTQYWRIGKSENNLFTLFYPLSRWTLNVFQL